jgi:hypothetical protein
MKLSLGENMSDLSDPDLNEIFSVLRNEWMNQTGESSAALARAMDERPQCVSSWSTGFNNRKPPLRIIQWLAKETDTDVKFGSSGLQVCDSGGELVWSSEAGLAQ